MKAIIQRVTEATVTVDGNLVSSIGKGLCVLVGIGRKDAAKDADWLVKKIINLRLFDGDDGKRWDKSVKDKNYEVLCVSQFTLHTILKGNKPDFHNSMGPDEAPIFYDNFIQLMKQNYSEDKIKNGVFGAMMQVHIQNDGPVTIPLESPENLPEPKVRKYQDCKITSRNQSSSSLASNQSCSSLNSEPAFKSDTAVETQDSAKDS
ncbi:D-aminoacyl-tRNA deacylase-like [Dreissena polymorpha]|uniref:D-aminoacyl-tRNA deacylase n=1 Tax=Dreissena polymorpha TaxID=45954 RepID=A0A9D4KY25_DREPO|nr:D-aminoacyl-tRNA deacylase-like [Dreissena polymorpha]XP_052273738.1 D-aminoacyl-tRNA deacylase-like [Dreissena polymorpha]KAH3848005.1 hypothetical protein DPMN_090341 [Dreissena polymorpha]